MFKYVGQSYNTKVGFDEWIYKVDILKFNEFAWTVEPPWVIMIAHVFSSRSRKFASSLWHFNSALQ